MEKEYRDRFSDREAAAVRHIRLIQVGVHAADRLFLPLLDVEVLERRRAAEPGRLRKPGEGGEAAVEKRLAGGARSVNADFVGIARVREDALNALKVFGNGTAHVRGRGIVV